MEEQQPQCQICSRCPSTKLLFSCVSCARNVLYEPRLRHAQALLYKEALGKEVEDALSAGSQPEAVKPDSAERSSSRITYERARNGCAASKLRTQDNLVHIEILREEVKNMRGNIAARKAALSRRKSDLEAARQVCAQQESQSMKPVQKSIAAAEKRAEVVHGMTVGDRMWRCRLAAQLWGVEQRKRQKGVRERDIYLIGGIPIPDLRDLNSATPTSVNAALSHLSYLLSQITTYLSIRLPAQVVLPSSATYPYPHIYVPISSYKQPTLPVPGYKSPTSASTDAVQARSSRKHRPLRLEKTLPILASEDNIAYAQFVEGISLLAWDIAWLCKTQGIDVGGQSLEDACAIGRTVYLLLTAPKNPSARPSLTSKNTAGAIKTPDKTSSSPSGTPSRTPSTSLTSTAIAALAIAKRPKAGPGRLSHGTSRSFLRSAEAADMMQDWPLAHYKRFIEKVKDLLISQRMGAEWEVLEEAEWENEGKEGKAAEVEGGRVARSYGAVKPTELDAPDGAEARREGTPGSQAGTAEDKDKDKEKNRTGYMKVRHRSGADGT